MFISRATLTIDGRQVVPGQVLQALPERYSAGLDHGHDNAYCRQMNEGEELVGCPDCDCQFTGAESLRYHCRLVHGSEPGHPLKGVWQKGISTKPY